VECAAGLSALDRCELGEACVFDFFTPQLDVEHSSAMQKLDLMPQFYAVFNQRIDMDAMLPYVKVKHGSRRVTVHTVCHDDFVADLSAFDPANCMLFAPTEPLVKNCKLHFAIECGAPSAEGSLPLQSKICWEASTYGPLKLLDVLPFQLVFSNALQANLDMVEVSPAIDNLHIVLGTFETENDSILIQGNLSVGVKYTVEVGSELTDRYEQTLGKSMKRTLEGGPCPPNLYDQSPAGATVVLNPATAGLSYPLYSVNFSSYSVRVFCVDLTDYPRFAALQSVIARGDVPASGLLPGKLVMDKLVKVEKSANAIVKTFVDLSSALDAAPAGHNQFIIFAKAVDTTFMKALFGKENTYVVCRWFQITDIGVHIGGTFDDQRFHCWLSSLSDCRPLRGTNVSLELLEDTSGEECSVHLCSGTTDDDGMVTLRGGETWIDPKWAHRVFIVCTHGTDTTIVPRVLIDNKPAQNQFAWYLVDGRRIYKTGDTLHMTGWVRRLERSRTPVLVRGDGGAQKVMYQIEDARHHEVAAGVVDVLSPLSGFDGDFSIHDELFGNGEYTLTLYLEGHRDSSRYARSIVIATHQTPDYCTVTQSLSSTPHFAGDEEHIFQVSIHHGGEGGEPLAFCSVLWEVKFHEIKFSPPGWSSYTFRKQRQWWHTASSADDEEDSVDAYVHETTFHGITNQMGRHSIQVDVTAFTPPPTTTTTTTTTTRTRTRTRTTTLAPTTLQLVVETTAHDLSNTAIISDTSILIHPCEYYIGIKSLTQFQPVDHPLSMEFIVVDCSGAGLADVDVTFSLMKLTWDEDTLTKTYCQVGTQDLRSGNGGAQTLSVSVCLSVPLCTSLCVSVSLCQCLSVSVCLSVPLCTSLCQCLSVSVCLVSLSVSVYLCVCISVSGLHLRISFSVCLCMSLCPCVCLCVCVSLSFPIVVLFIFVL